MEEIEYKITTVEQKEPYIITCKCDRCNKIIFKVYGKQFYPRNRFSVYPIEVSWYEVRTGHNDWGNDSCESIANKTICPSCLVNEYSDYVDRTSGGANTHYIEIEHNYGRSLPLEGTEECSK